ncbi:hypothetical protein GQ44DRAFT_700526 [Phaeosphaeriaceae sp. PMI808]|nr:hypothetical protein GQ44DRAFT_700526 [Phaeosphaeriaceae sp. PMI808]
MVGRLIRKSVSFTDAPPTIHLIPELLCSWRGCEHAERPSNYEVLNAKLLVWEAEQEIERQMRRFCAPAPSAGRVQFFGSHSPPLSEHTSSIDSF